METENLTTIRYAIHSARKYAFLKHHIKLAENFEIKTMMELDMRDIAQSVIEGPEIFRTAFMRTLKKWSK